MAEAALRAEIDSVATAIKASKAEKGADAPETRAFVAKMAELRKKLPQKDVKEKAKAPAQTEHTYYESRVKLVEELGSLTGAYPHSYRVDLTVPAFIAKFNESMKENGNFDKTQEMQLAGRITTKRSASSKLQFIVIQGDGAQLQILSTLDAYVNPQAFALIHSRIKRGDIIGIRGHPGRSNTGELSLLAVEITLLSICFHMLPDDWFGFRSVEQRFRQRHLDLIVNRRPAEIFARRAAIISFIREFLNARNFVEVETPILNIIPGGAAARPFVTHHNDLNQQMFLRIAPELRLKQLVVGGMDRVYEIGRQFRNEGIDLTHNPEFTSCEFYWAYKDYNDLMDVTEEMLHGLVMRLFGVPKVTFAPTDQEGKPMPPTELNFERPFKRLFIVPELEKRTGVAFPKEFDSAESTDWLMKLCVEKKVPFLPPITPSRLFDAMIAHYLEPECVSPTFLCDHPRVMSPLAKWHRNDSRLSERFELFMNKKEVVNAFTELNNPLVQREAFMGQLLDRMKGDDEAMMIDEEFLNALEFGLPPTAGWGLGVDRVAMFLTSNVSIKEVLLFPTMKPEEVGGVSYPPNTKFNGNRVPLLRRPY